MFKVGEYGDAQIHRKRWIKMKERSKAKNDLVGGGTVVESGQPRWWQTRAQDMLLCILPAAPKIVFSASVPPVHQGKTEEEGRCTGVHPARQGRTCQQPRAGAVQTPR